MDWADDVVAKKNRPSPSKMSFFIGMQFLSYVKSLDTGLSLQSPVLRQSPITKNRLIFRD